MIIAFGRISYYKPTAQYYLNIVSDLNIIKINYKELREQLNEKAMKRKTIVKKEDIIKKEHNSV